MTSPQLARHRPTEIWLKLFKGGEQNAYDIVDWVNASGGTARYSPGIGNQVMIDTDIGTLVVKPGDFVGVAGRNRIVQIDPAEMERTYDFVTGGKTRMEWAEDAVVQANHWNRTLSIFGLIWVAGCAGFIAAQVWPW